MIVKESKKGNEPNLPSEKLNDYHDIINQFLNTAISLDEKKDYEQALNYYSKTLEVISEALKIKFEGSVWPESQKLRKNFQNYQKNCVERKKKIQYFLATGGLQLSSQSSPTKSKQQSFEIPVKEKKRIIINKPKPQKRQMKKKIIKVVHPPTNGTNGTKQRRIKKKGKDIFSKVQNQVKSFFMGDINTQQGQQQQQQYIQNSQPNQIYQYQNSTQFSKQSKVKQPKVSLSNLDVSKNPHLKGIDKKMINMVLDELLDKTSNYKFSDIAGLENAKNILKESIILPNLRPDLFEGLTSPPKGVLLFGPPGNGKTLLGKAVANESNCKFFAISASSLVSKWHGESEKMVRALFGCARFLSPSIIFIDEIDSILSARSSNEHEASRRLKTEFLVQIDGVTTDNKARVLVLGATNLPFELDDAILRRFIKRVHIPLPHVNGRKELIKAILNKHAQKHVINETGFNEIAENTKFYSGSDLAALCRESSMIPLRELGANVMNVRKQDLRPIGKEDFFNAIKRVKPSCDLKLIKKIEGWDKKYGSN